MSNIYTVFRFFFFYNNQMKFVKERIQTSIHHVTTMYVYTQEYENPHWINKTVDLHKYKSRSYTSRLVAERLCNETAGHLMKGPHKAALLRNTRW